MIHASYSLQLVKPLTCKTISPFPIAENYGLKLLVVIPNNGFIMNHCKYEQKQQPMDRQCHSCMADNVIYLPTTSGLIAA